MLRKVILSLLALNSFNSVQAVDRTSTPEQFDSKLFKWVKQENGNVPANAMAAGSDDSQRPDETQGNPTLFICRASYNGGLHPGKVRPELKACNIPFGGQEISVTSYEILVEMASQSMDANLDADLSSPSCHYYNSRPIKLTNDGRIFKAAVEIPAGKCEESAIKISIFDDKKKEVYSESSLMKYVFYHDTMIPGPLLVQSARTKAKRSLDLVADTFFIKFEPENIEEECGFGLNVSVKEYQRLAEAKTMAFTLGGVGSVSYYAYIPETGKVVNYAYDGC